MAFAFEEHAGSFGGREAGGGEVVDGDEIVALGGRFEVGWTADGERDADAEVIAVGEAAGHSPEVVAGDDYEGVLEFAALGEEGEEFGAFGIEALDFAGVGVEFEADGRGVWEVGREGKLGGPGVGGRGPGDVRIVAAEPEAEGLGGGFGLEERVERRVGWAGGIAGWGEELEVGRLAGREGAVEAGGGTEGVGPLAGEQAGAGGGAAGVRGEGVVEESAFGGDAVEGGGGHSAAVGGGVGIGPVIGQEEENIGSGGGEGGGQKLAAGKRHGIALG